MPRDLALVAVISKLTAWRSTIHNSVFLVIQKLEDRGNRSVSIIIMFMGWITHRKWDVQKQFILAIQIPLPMYRRVVSTALKYIVIYLKTFLEMGSRWRVQSI